MQLYLINPCNPLVSLTRVKESRWNRYRVWKPLSLLVLAGLTPREWEISILDENLGTPDYSAMPRPDLVGIGEVDGVHNLVGDHAHACGCYSGTRCSPRLAVLAGVS